ncbi:MAG: CubicO group peptidase beta-lactamase class family [Ferruginibacter sp.]|nr:CubicO group peptidase beta-lactamase class family [Ferruginibacter sp.]
MNKPFRGLLALCSLVIFFSTSLSAQKTVQGLDDFLKNIQANSKLPGFAVAVVKKDAILFSKAYGYADKKKKTPYTPETIQPVGSVSKTFIALALMQGVEKGWFTMETPVNDILPFKVINPNFPTEPIRIKHLVTHTSGLLDNEVCYSKTYTASKKPSAEMNNFLKGYYTPGGTYYDTANFSHTAPGKKYVYSNIASALAAYIVEIKAKVSFPAYCATNIFNPLRMTDSHWLYDESKAGKYATLYEVNRQEQAIYKDLVNSDGSVKNYSCVTYPDGSLKTSLNDLTKYLGAMIKGYSGEGVLLTKPSYDKLFMKQFTPQNMPATMDPREPNRAVFWSYNRKGRIGHTGSDIGIAAFISFDPVTKTGRVVMINTELEGMDNITVIEAFVNLMKGLDNFEAGK